MSSAASVSSATSVVTLTPQSDYDERSMLDMASYVETTAATTRTEHFTELEVGINVTVHLHHIHAGEIPASPSTFGHIITVSVKGGNTTQYQVWADPSGPYVYDGKQCVAWGEVVKRWPNKTVHCSGYERKEYFLGMCVEKTQDASSQPGEPIERSIIKVNDHLWSKAWKVDIPVHHVKYFRYRDADCYGLADKYRNKMNEFFEKAKVPYLQKLDEQS
jgi:hypothetical protein